MEPDDSDAKVCVCAHVLSKGKEGYKTTFLRCENYWYLLHEVIWSFTLNFTARQRPFYKLNVCISGTNYAYFGLI